MEDVNRVKSVWVVPQLFFLFLKKRVGVVDIGDDVMIILRNPHK